VGVVATRSGGRNCAPHGYARLSQDAAEQRQLAAVLTTEVETPDQPASVDDGDAKLGMRFAEHAS
jgi:hypothetical protein